MLCRLLQQSFDAFDEAAAARLGVNRTDLRALDVVLGAGPVTAGELTAALRLSPAATTTVIDRLERSGLVARTRDSTNRRRVLVEATTAARAAEREIYRPVGEAGLHALARYDRAQLEAILDFLTTARRLQQEHAERVAAGPLLIP
ncbi:MarR family winged helix-turn-helix transcriptional regulator [Micromonospora viridifaciens]|uniref:MarR family winged helix-turn-helix transcriptional regulator n=1 Tax=Micromonospora viridifaciens TaxID=1881 RepID=UPI001E36294E|nr:MarR family transcriptional regulator [Micromonospora viridifaciens]